MAMAANDRAARALDDRLTSLRRWPSARPPRGWLRAVRDALGLTTRQYAARLGVSQPQVVAYEKGEVEESISVANLRRAAEALDCELVYALVPRRPLTETLRKRAEQIADARLARMGHTMRLENQEVAGPELKRQRDSMVDELLRGKLRRLWEEVP
jgi:predicted DNA-binding mobile mystery protein A